MNTAYKFQLDPPPASLAEITRLEGDGYRVHKEWENGIEMRKKNKIGALGAAILCFPVYFAPIIALPLFGRSILDVLLGYKYRAFVTRDPDEPKVF